MSTSTRFLPPGRAGLSGVQSGAPATGGPRLVRDAVLAAERRLPLPGEVSVTPGQLVDPETMVATAPNVPSRLHVVELSRMIGRPLSPTEVREALLVGSGQAVRAGEPLARISRATWIGREVSEAPSPADGVVEFISHARGQVVIRGTGEARDERVVLPVANALGLLPAELPKHATCRPGQEVSPGDVLARGDPLQPLGGEYRSPVAGVVESVSKLTGTITIIRRIEPLVLRAYLAGRVVRLLPGYGAVIAARGHRVLGALGLGGKGWGRLVPVEDGPGPPRPAVLAGLRGAVVATPGAVTAAALAAYRTAGARGLVCGSARAIDLGRFIGRPLAAEIITGPGAGWHSGTGLGAGPDEAGMAVIITEGFGHLPMDRITWELLLGHAGQVVSVDGQTQIRAGVVRPSVLIPVQAVPEDPGTEAGPDPAPFLPPGRGLTPPSLEAGQRVRIVRQPHFGLWGRVLEPPGGLVRLETEVEARVLAVALDDGRVVRVAEANIEV